MSSSTVFQIIFRQRAANPFADKFKLCAFVESACAISQVFGRRSPPPPEKKRPLPRVCNKRRPSKNLKAGRPEVRRLCFLLGGTIPGLPGFLLDLFRACISQTRFLPQLFHHLPVFWKIFQSNQRPGYSTPACAERAVEFPIVALNIFLIFSFSSRSTRIASVVVCTRPTSQVKTAALGLERPAARAAVLIAE